MFQPLKIAPSVLSADFMNMGRDIAMIEQGGADWVHVDVMDGHFVPNLTMGVPFVKDLKRVTDLPIDVHLMIANPLEELPWFIAVKPDVITVHYEAFVHPETELDAALAMIHDAGIKAAISIKPNTPTAALKPWIANVDMVLVMSVYPGFSGQSYIEGSEDKVAEVVSMALNAGVSPLIQVDGGVSPATIERLASAGADVVVMGSACFAAEDPAANMAEVRSRAAQAVAALDADK